MFSKRILAGLTAVVILLCACQGGTTSAEKTTKTVSDTTVTVTGNETAVKNDFAVSSPSGHLTVTVHRNDEGTVSYAVTDKERLTILACSAVGLQTDVCDFSEDLSFVSQKPVTEIDETYHTRSGKHSQVRNHYRETVLTFAKEKYFFDLTVRAYDDGFAYRFGVRAKDGAPHELQVIKEISRFALPAQSTITAQQVTDLTAPFNYENRYVTASVESFDTAKPSYLCFPALADLANSAGEPAGKYLLLSEAELFGDSYFGSLLCAQGSNAFDLHAAPQVNSDMPAVIRTDFTSPWRYGIYGDLGDIVESDLTENLAPAFAGDDSWVEPGVSAWMWLSEGFYGQRNISIIKDYVDLVAEMGWKYLILDEGWQPDSRQKGKAYNGYFSYCDKLVTYAEQKGVGFIVWVKYVDLDTPEEREILREWAAKGIKGIKADFFDNEDQQTMADLKAIYEMCGECHLLVNCHGAGKPTGERRTYPHVINREAVNGEEFGAFFVRDAVIWPYTRNVVGPMDITPRLYPTGKKGTKTTLAAQLACPIIFESGIPCMAGDTTDYRGFNRRDFFRDLPASWDDTRFLDGTPGDSVTLARRAGDNWYAATLTLTAKKGQTMPLSFLGEGTYEATVYSDKTKREIQIDTRIVTSDDTLTYDLPPESGYVVKFTPYTSTDERG